LDKRQGDLGLKENGQHRKRNRAGAITMKAAVEELTPLGVLKQPKVLGAWSEVWTYSRAGIVHSNLAGARDIERRAIPKCAMPAVPPPAWKLGFDQPCRSVNRARHIRRDRAKCTLELAVEFRRATGSGLDLLQKFPQVHFSHPPRADGPELYSNLLSVALMKDSAYRSGRSPDWLKMKNADAPAVKREAEEDWSKERRR
jgi:hypothetical protein